MRVTLRGTPTPISCWGAVNPPADFIGDIFRGRRALLISSAGWLLIVCWWCFPHRSPQIKFFSWRRVNWLGEHSWCKTNRYPTVKPSVAEWLPNGSEWLASYKFCSIDQSINWLIVWLIDWLIDLLIGWLVDWSIDRFIHLPGSPASSESASSRILLGCLKPLAPET